MQRVVVDANVLLSFIVDRNEKQRAVVRALLLRAEEGELVVIVPQFVVFEVVHVPQSAYRIPGEEVKPMIRDLIARPAWAYPDFVDRLVLGSGGDSRLTLLELHG